MLAINCLPLIQIKLFYSNILFHVGENFHHVGVLKAMCILRRLVVENSQLILDAGYIRNLHSITLNDKEQVIRALFLNATIYRSMAELDQLKAGLNVLGVYDEMTKNPDAFLYFFTKKDQKLSAGKYVELRLIARYICLYIHSYTMWLVIFIGLKYLWIL